MDNDYVMAHLKGAIDILNELKGYVFAHDYIPDEKPKFTKFPKNKIIMKFNDYIKTSVSRASNIGEEELEPMPKGSISHRKDGRWMGRFYFMNKYFYVYDKSETGCWNKLRAKRKETINEHKNSNAITKNMSFNTWFDYWASTYKVHSVKESTFHKINEVYNRYARNGIGTQKISSLNSSKIQNFINDLSAYSAKQKMHQMFKELFDALHKENYTKTDLMALVVLPKRENKDLPGDFTKLTETILSYENELIFLSTLKNTKSYLPCIFVLYTGLRRGELLGLKWENVDISNQTIRINQQFNMSTHKISSLKSNASYRTVPLLEPALNVLLELNNISHELDDFVFPDIVRFSQIIGYHAKKIGLTLTPHSLRHTFASRCYAAGVDPKMIQQLLGHESIDTTMNIYTHAMTSADKEIIIKMREFFIKKGIIILLENNT